MVHATILRPNGSLIGSTQQKPHRHDVVFFERNGLQHGEFPLVTTPLGCGSDGDAGGQLLHVHEMMWSSDSAVLALWIIKKRKSLQQGTDGVDASPDSQEDTSGIYAQLRRLYFLFILGFHSRGGMCLVPKFKRGGGQLHIKCKES